MTAAVGEVSVLRSADAWSFFTPSLVTTFAIQFVKKIHTVYIVPNNNIVYTLRLNFFPFIHSIIYLFDMINIKLLYVLNIIFLE